jgi:molecular chaperone GrpE
MAKGKSKKDLEQEIGELTADLQRIQADFVNFKRRSEEDVSRARMSGKSSMVMALLPVIDNLERALSHQPKELAKNEWAKGVKKTSEQLMKELSNLGVYKIDTKDQEFNPDFMDAVSVEGEGDKEIVAEELQAGYIMNEEVIRPAMVKVERK